MLKTYHGGCHCGAVRFTAEIDISAGTAKCNCSYCTRRRLWSVSVTPNAMRITKGQDGLGDYSGKNPVAHHLFCRECGISPFDRVDMPNMSGSVYYNICVSCLDDVDVDELMAAPVTYIDGLHNDWGSTPAETRHL